MGMQTCARVTKPKLAGIFFCVWSPLQLPYLVMLDEAPLGSSHTRKNSLSRLIEGGKKGEVTEETQPLEWGLSHFSPGGRKDSYGLM